MVCHCKIFSELSTAKGEVKKCEHVKVIEQNWNYFVNKNEEYGRYEEYRGYNEK
jgi:hypothetical protein